MSMANAISVKRAARNDTSDATRVTVMWEEKLSNKATKVTAVAAILRLKTMILDVFAERLTNWVYSKTTGVGLSNVSLLSGGGDDLDIIGMTFARISVK